MIYEFITHVCNQLSIRCPNFDYKTSTFPTKTMLAQYESEGNIIHIRRTDSTPDMFFAIAHELRHVWQIRIDEKLYMGSYKNREDCSSIEEYNMQLAEIDANAFAGLMVMEQLNLTPLYEGMSQAVKNKIYSRIKEIRKDF